MMPHKSLILSVTLAFFIIACGNEPSGDEKLTDQTYTFCECILPADSIKEACSIQFPQPMTEQDSIAFNQAYFDCTGEFAFSTSADEQIMEEAMEAYANDLSLEIKEIPEEKEDPISAECKELLEDYADAIKSYTKLMDKLQKNPDDINLLISRGAEEEELYSYSSKPLTFQCSQNKAFKKQMEILNGKRDKLLSN
jgi:hypothetical protein